MTVGMTTTREIEGEARLLGCGVSYCATCDGALYKNKDIAVNNTPGLIESFKKKAPLTRIASPLKVTEDTFLSPSTLAGSP